MALRIGCDSILALQIKLKMFGVHIAGLENVLLDNHKVLRNESIFESTL